MCCSRQAQRGPVRPRGTYESRRRRAGSLRRRGARRPRASCSRRWRRAYRFDESCGLRLGTRCARAVLDGSDGEGVLFGHRCSGCWATAISTRHRDLHGRATRLRHAAGHGSSISALPDLHRTARSSESNRRCSSVWSVRSVFSPCIGDGRFHHGGRRQRPAAAPTSTIALDARIVRHRRDPARPQGQGRNRFARKASTAPGRSIEPARERRWWSRGSGRAPVRAGAARAGHGPHRRRIVNAPPNRRPSAW